NQIWPPAQKPHNSPQRGKEACRDDEIRGDLRGQNVDRAWEVAGARDRAVQPIDDGVHRRPPNRRPRRPEAVSRTPALPAPIGSFSPQAPWVSTLAGVIGVVAGRGGGGGAAALRGGGAGNATRA